MNKKDNLRFLDTVNQISLSENLDGLRQVVVDIRKRYNLANIVYHAVYIPESSEFHPLLILTYDPDWVERYKSNDYFKIDPVVNFGRKSFLPLDWSVLDRESNSIVNFFREADRYGVGRQGVTFPVRGASGERALFTITSNMSPSEWQKYHFIYMKEFQLISHYFHERAIQLSGYRALRKTPDLSAREMQCLELTAHGLVPKRVADRLKIPDTTVRMYLRSACRKLECASVHQAVAKMITLELIHPLA